MKSASCTAAQVKRRGCSIDDGKHVAQVMVFARVFIVFVVLGFIGLVGF